MWIFILDTHRAQINSFFKKPSIGFLKPMCYMQNPLIDYSPRKREIDHMDAKFLYKTNLYTETSQAAKKDIVSNMNVICFQLFLSMIS